MSDKPVNPMAEALDSGKGRRRVAGERSGGSAKDRDLEMQRCGVDLPRGLYREVKLLAALHDMTAQAIIQAAVADQVATRKSRTALLITARRELPVSALQ